jgi:hypothetical protein
MHVGLVHDILVILNLELGPEPPIYHIQKPRAVLVVTMHATVSQDHTVVSLLEKLMLVVLRFALLQIAQLEHLCELKLPEAPLTESIL